MSSFNKIIIVGYLGRDPELRYTPQGTAVCDFSIATTERRKDSAGELQDVTTWFKVTAWKRQAELANQYLAKGRQVYIEGRLRQEEYTDREGNRRTILKVDVSDMHFMGTRGEEAAAHSTAPGQSARPQARTEEEEPASGVISDEDIPF
jgi:single-strand DNA-binding protein